MGHFSKPKICLTLRILSTKGVVQANNTESEEMALTSILTKIKSKLISKSLKGSLQNLARLSFLGNLTLETMMSKYTESLVKS